MSDGRADALDEFLLYTLHKLVQELTVILRLVVAYNTVAYVFSWELSSVGGTRRNNPLFLAELIYFATGGAVEIRSVHITI